MMDIPRIILSGTSSRVGKTMISIGLMRALVNRGYRVQPYKVGPDFIDPSFHFFATGKHSRNLDSFMLSKEDIVETFERNFRNADIAVIEGTMGLHDSHHAIDEKGSTAEVSKILKCPVILIANVERMSRTVAPFIYGYKTFDPEVRIEGVILNRVGSERHAMKAKLAAEKLAKVKVVGIIPRRKDVVIPDRHLGLIPAYERKEEFEELFDKLAELIEEYVKVDDIVEIAEKAPPLREVPEHPIFNGYNCGKMRVRVGIFRDRSFNFYYQDNVDAIAARAEVVVIDSLSDKKLPDVDALYVGGGFPEVFAEELEKNKSLRRCVYDFCDSGKPVYAECGGLMFLGEVLRLVDGSEYEMVGFMPYETEMHKRFQALGYSIYKCVKSSIVARRGDIVKGHEFHYSKVIPKKNLDFTYRVKRGKGIDGERDGAIKKNTLVNYIHVHVLSYPALVRRFIRSAQVN